MNDDELDEFLENAFDNWWRYNSKFDSDLVMPWVYVEQRNQTRKVYIAIAKHLMEFTDKEMKNDTTN